MHSSKLVRVLKKFTDEEIKNFKKFLNTAPVKNNIILFKIIYLNYPFLDTSRLKKENVFKKLYPGQVYKSGKLEKQMSSLFALVEEFIVDQYADETRALHELLTLSDFYRSRKLPALATICTRKYRKILAAHNPENPSFWYDSFLLEKQLSDDQALLVDPKIVLNLPQTHGKLDQFYVYEKLENACRMLAMHRFILPLDLGKSLVLLEHLIPLLETDFFESPIIKVYYKAYCFLVSKDEDLDVNFLELEAELNQFQKRLPEQQLIALNAIVRNYYITQYHKGRTGFLEKSFFVYQDHLQRGYLYHDGRLFASTMMNLVVSGLLLKQYDWVFKFINEHRSKITGTSSAEEVIRLNLANYYFHIIDYEKALEYLTDNYEDIYFKLRAKRMEIKIYYETKHVLLEPKMDAFKTYIYRFPTKKITKKYKEGNTNFIGLLKQILLPRTVQNSKRIDKLINKIDQLEFIVEKEWLLEKIEDLR